MFISTKLIFFISFILINLFYINAFSEEQLENIFKESLESEEKIDKLDIFLDKILKINGNKENERPKEIRKMKTIEDIIEFISRYILRCFTPINKLENNNSTVISNIKYHVAINARSKITSLMIASIPNYVVEFSTNMGSCSLCTNVIYNDIVKLGCGHYFHSECLITMLQNNIPEQIHNNSLFNCPNCRNLIKGYKIKKTKGESSSQRQQRNEQSSIQSSVVDSLNRYNNYGQSSSQNNQYYGGHGSSWNGGYYP